MMEETLRYEKLGRSLGDLSKEIIQKLMQDGYQVQSNTRPGQIIIQAKKNGLLRDIISADRAFTILITGTPEDFTIRVGVGKMVQNLAVAAAEALLVSELFLVVDVPEMVWTKHVENSIVKDIEGIVGQKAVQVTKA